MKCPKCGYSDELIGNQNPSEISEIGLSLIKSFEGKHNTGYLCPAGVWTIGYGHTGTTFDQPSPKGMTITDEQIDILLKEDMKRFEKAVLRSVAVALTQNQFDALVSFAFNAGAAEQFLVWNKATNPQTKKKVALAGLTRRRQSERHMFLTGELKVDF